MSRSLDRLAILDALRALDRLDRERRIFGAQSHDYQLNPPISKAALDAFEHNHRVHLPDDYRYFLAEIGDGGAGPFYGLFPFGMNDHGHSLGKWEEGFLVGDLSAEFPHEAAWDLPVTFWEKKPSVPPDAPPEEQERLYDEWDRTVDQHYWDPQIMRGAVPICHRGCSLRQWLVLQGPLKGTIWNDDRVDRKGIRPLLDEQGRHVTFAVWYLSWLEQANVEAWASHHKRG